MTTLEMTDADDALLSELHRRGLTDYTPRKLQRLREQHLIASPTRREAGRAGGRPSIAYPPGTADRIAAAQQLLDRGYSYREVRFELVWRGDYPLPIEVVRDDFQALFDAMAGVLPVTEDPADAADQFVRERYLQFSARTPVGRAQARRSGAPARAHGTVLEDAHVTLVGLAFGLIDPDEVNLEAFARAYGFPLELAEEIVATSSLAVLPIVRERATRLTDADIDRYRPLAHAYLYAANALRSDAEVMAEFPGLADQPDADDPEVRAFALISVIAVSEFFPGWDETIFAAAKALRETGNFRTMYV